MKLVYIKINLYSSLSRRRKPTDLGGEVRTVRKFEILEHRELLNLRVAGNHAGKLAVILKQVLSQSLCC